MATANDSPSLPTYPDVMMPMTDAAPVEQRAAAVAGIDRGVGLHERRASDLAQGADDAAGDGVLQESERRADRDDFLARCGRWLPIPAE